jgi:pyruvate dehydrogenase E1 component beta subunit
VNNHDFWNSVPEVPDDRYYQKDPPDSRILNWAEATREALRFGLEKDNSVFLMGEGVDDPYAMFGTTRDLYKEFGPDRVFDVPIAEAGITGIAVGTAQAGMHPLYFHNRPDFLYLAMDQLANHAAKWAYMFAGQVPIPLLIWCCVGRGWAGAGAQHSQTMQGLFAHIPGLKVVMPASCFDTKGLMLAAIKDRNPVIIIDHRYNFNMKGHVPQEPYLVPLGKGVIRRPGRDVTIVATSHLVFEAWQAAEELAKKGIEVEIIDPRTLKPLDEELILQSLEKTGRLIISDTDWKSAGFAAEVAALAAEKGFSFLKAPVKRVTAPDTPTPTGSTLETGYYISKEDIFSAVQSIMK